MVSSIVLLPLAILALGALPAWLYSTRDETPYLRYLSLVVPFGLALMSVLAIALVTPAALEVPFWRPLLPQAESLRIEADRLGQRWALLLLLVLGLTATATLLRPLRRSEGVAVLLLGMATVGAAFAGDLLFLCLAWMLIDVALIGVEVTRVPDEALPHAARRLLGGLVSTVALVGATVLALSEHGTLAWAELTFTGGWAHRLLLLAALLRLGVYPLPGSLKRHWLAYVAAVSAGGCLWLRLVAASPEGLPAARELATLAGIGLMATGLIAASARDLGAALPALFSQGISLVILAPALDPVLGLGPAMVGLMSLLLCVGLLRIDGYVRAVPPLGRLARLPMLVALASLGGWPLTLGGASRWLLLQASLHVGHIGLWLPVLVGTTLAGLALWQRVRLWWREAEGLAGQGEPGERLVAPAAGGALALLTTALGLTPTLFGWAWPTLPPEYAAPSFGQMFSAGPAMTWLLLAAVVAPVGGSLALLRWLRRRPFRGRLDREIGWLAAFLELDWLYLGLERLAAWLRAGTDRVSQMVEEGFYLGWTLLWGLVLTMLMVGRL